MLIWDGRQNSGLDLYHVKKLAQYSGGQRTRDNWKRQLDILMVGRWVVTARGCDVLCFDKRWSVSGVFEVCLCESNSWNSINSKNPQQEAKDSGLVTGISFFPSFLREPFLISLCFCSVFLDISALPVGQKYLHSFPHPRLSFGCDTRQRQGFL